MPAVFWAAVATFVVHLEYTTTGLTRSVIGPDLAKNLIHNATFVACAVVCLLAALERDRRSFYAAIGAGMGLWAAGDIVYWTWIVGGAPGASASDILYAGFYPLAYAALVSETRRRRTRSLPGHAVLDAGVAAFLLAAICTTFAIAPVMADEGMTLYPLAVAYLIGDLLLACLLVGVFAMTSWAGGRRLACFATGLLVFAVGDVLYLVQGADGTYGDGTAVDASWAAGMILMAASALIPRGEAGNPSATPGWSALVWPSVFTAASAMLLAYGSFEPLPGVAIALALCAVAGGIVRAGMTFRDVRRLFDSHREARTDQLTGLANRRRFFSDLASELAEARRSTGGLALLLVDLDRFKELNDSLGHHAGDALLREMGPRLRRAAGPDAKLARLGGDEFAVILRPGDDAEGLADRLREELDRPFAVHELPIAIEASIGVARFPDHGSGSERLLRCADIAMYRAKRTHKGVAVYSPADDRTAPDRVHLMSELREGIAAGQLVVHYQPKVALADGRVIGVEALVRWQHPQRGLLAPGAFLPAAEQTALLRPLTLSVLEQALDQAARWHEHGCPLEVAVNLSAANLLDGELAGAVRDRLEARGLPSSALRLEITESTVMADPARAGVVLAQLHDLGVGLTLDDFGTGYSSLAYLRELPVDEMKIDKSFVLDLPDNHGNRVILDATTRLARGLALNVVAEGVEDERTLHELTALGCDSAQGFLISRPLPAADLETCLARAGADWWWPQHPRFVKPRNGTARKPA
jgi:diguanylate cyclase (GGDEF)-like protein